MQTVNGWQIYLLQHDLATWQLAHYFRSQIESGLISKIRLETHRRTSRQNIENAISQALSSVDIDGATPLFLYGHGRYHHYTYGLCKVVADAISSEYGYIHIDMHQDGISLPGVFQDEKLNGGRFVNFIKNSTNATIVRHISGYGALTNYLENPGGLPGSLYLSLDLDVLHSSEFMSGYSQSSLALSDLLAFLKLVKEKRKVIGADILGYAPRLLSRTLLYPHRKSIQAYQRAAELLTGTTLYGSHSDNLLPIF